MQFDHGCLALNLRLKDGIATTNFGEFSFYELDYSSNRFTFFYLKSSNVVKLVYQREKGYLKYVGTECKPKHELLATSIPTKLNGTIDNVLSNRAEYEAGKTLQKGDRFVVEFKVKPNSIDLYDLGYITIMGKMSTSGFGKGTKVKYNLRRDVVNGDFL